MESSPLEQSAESILRSLNAGKVISGSAATHAFGRSVEDPIHAALRFIFKNQQPIDGGAIRQTFWITGQPGNGKSQSLNHFIHLLPKLDSQKKYAVSYFDLGQRSDAKRHDGIALAIVRKLLLEGIGVPGLKERWIDAIQNKPFRGQGNVENLAFAADCLCILTGTSPSAFTISVNRFYRALQTLLPCRRWRIKAKIAEKYCNNPEMVSLLNAWTDYFLNPSKYESDLVAVLSRLNDRGSLFNLFCSAMHDSGYTTLVLVFDEVTDDAVAGFKKIWDLKADSNPINIVFLLASPNDVWERIDANQSFQRRFCVSPNLRVEIPAPDVTECRQAVEKIESLLSIVPHLRRLPAPGAAEVVSAFEDGCCNRQRMWHIVIDKLVQF